MNAIERYIEIAERFSWKLACRKRERERETLDENLNDEQMLFLLDQYHAKDRLLYQIRNELDAATSSAVNEIKTLGLDATPVSKTTLAAWHYHDRFQEEWFNCHSFLRVVNATLCNKADDIVAHVDRLFAACTGSHADRGKEMAAALTDEQWKDYKDARGGRPITQSIEQHFTQRSKDATKKSK